MDDRSPNIQPFRVGASVYRRDRPMTEKGRVTAVWWSKRTGTWHVEAVFPDGHAHTGADRLVEVPRN